AQRRQILDLTARFLSGRPFIAGAYIEGEDGETFSLYTEEMDAILERGGTPILFQSSALVALSEPQLLALHEKLAKRFPKWLIFELGSQFAPFGKIYPLELLSELMQIPSILGLKHSSLSRQQEWKRLELRNQLRPEFKIYTGNDLAIDMVIYGSDYLLGLSTFAPDYFALRDRYWEIGDARFYELNDILQFLGQFAFRPPVPAYKHSAAQFLQLRGWLTSAEPPPNSPRRPESDRETLQVILEKLAEFSPH
ncbi:MAG: hypothetical protein RML93_06620, partial [Anaerolineales bacterium]|nr:hypothetical protein [Anaerolineales bacterium]MDW8446949.1 hypothetical protein [Anaerolineales bacterium]